MIRFIVTKGPGQPPAFQLEAVVELETDRAIDPATFTSDSQVEWNLLGITITAMTLPEEKKAPPLKK
jgi:hypothetical protein